MSHDLTCLAQEPIGSSTASAEELYADRKLSEGHPDLEKLALEMFTATLEANGDMIRGLEKTMAKLDKLTDLKTAKNIVVIGCGPKPAAMKYLTERSYNVVGVEPVTSFVRSACEYLGSDVAVLEGAAERIPLADGSQDIVLCDSVLEHVISPTKSMDEMYRVLAPGGIAVVTTTNKYKVSLFRSNHEYTHRYYNWLPGMVKESIVFKHLHYDPRLANYSHFPAVHWFTYSRLCALGREAGFARFYSTIDLMGAGDDGVKDGRLKQWVVKKVKTSPWLRALVLTQRGDTIFMLKK